MVFKTIAALLFLAATASAATEVLQSPPIKWAMYRGERSPKLPTQERLALACLHRFIASRPNAYSVDAYLIDGYRSAVEYKYRNKDGNEAVGDVMLSYFEGMDVSYEFLDVHGGTSQAGNEDMDLVLGQRDVDSRRMETLCHVTGGFDDTVPGPHPRTDWLKVNLAHLAR
jgi:hypothetical protein